MAILEDVPCQLYFEGGGALQPRIKHISEGNSLRDVVPGSHVHAFYSVK